MYPYIGRYVDWNRIAYKITYSYLAITHTLCYSTESKIIGGIFLHHHISCSGSTDVITYQYLLSSLLWLDF